MYQNDGYLMLFGKGKLQSLKFQGNNSSYFKISASLFYLPPSPPQSAAHLKSSKLNKRKWEGRSISKKKRHIYYVCFKILVQKLHACFIEVTINKTSFVFLQVGNIFINEQYLADAKYLV